MATSSPATNPKSSNQSFRTGNTTLISHTFFKTVYLQDWWLVKADRDFHGKRLAVGGIATREQHAVRVFSSAPIVKRLDTFTLETSDGITVAIKGLINSCRTIQNGFSMEVPNHFLIGFPYYWEDYITQYFDTCTGGVPTSISDFNEQTMPSFDIRPSPGIPDSCLLAKGYLNDILKKLSNNGSEIPGVSIRSYLNRSSASMNWTCSEEETTSRCKEARIGNKQKIGKDCVGVENAVERTGVLFTSEEITTKHEGLNKPETIVLEGNSTIKSHDTTVAENSILQENSEVNLLEAELQVMNSTPKKNEDGTGCNLEVCKRRGSSNSEQQRCIPKRLDSSKCNRKDEKRTVCGSNTTNLNVARYGRDKTSGGNSSSFGGDGLEGNIDQPSPKRRISRKKTERPTDSICRRSSIRIRNLQNKLKKT